MKPHNRLQRAFDWAIKNGWSISKSGHGYRFSKPGMQCVYTSGSPSCRHASNQIIRDMRRVERGVYKTTTHS